jgi:hypothetical protein
MLLHVLSGIFGVWSVLRGAGILTAPAVVESPLFTPVSSIALIPLNGFLLRITRDVVAGFDVPLPEWSEARGILRDGAKLWALLTLWSLPWIVVRLVIGDADDASGQRALGADTFVSLGELVITFVQPAAVAWLAATGLLAAGLNVRAVLATVRRNVGGYVLVSAVIVGSFILAFALSALLLLPAWRGLGRLLSLDDLAAFIAISLGVTIIVFAPYLFCVHHHLYGQAFVRANPMPLPLPPPGTPAPPAWSEPNVPDRLSAPRPRRRGERRSGSTRTRGKRTR